MAELGRGAGVIVSAQKDADLLWGVCGDKRLVLKVGRQMEAAIIDNNTVRVYDGIVVSKGRDMHVPANTYDDFTIETGTQNVTRYDIIGYHLYKSGGEELCENFVRKDVTEDEIIVEADLREGADEVYISMYKVKIEGITITELIPLYSKVKEEEEIVDTGWITPKITDKFRAYNSEFTPVYRKIGKQVEVMGAVAPINAISATDEPQVIFTLPEGFRPRMNLAKRAQGSGLYTWLCTIETNGNVGFSRYGNMGSNSYAAASSSAFLPFEETYFVD